MTGAGINSGDILIVDRSVTAVNNSIIVAVLNGDFTVKRLVKRGSSAYLLPENPAYEPIEIKSGSEFEVWGVVMHVIHSVR
jgi:DNA polymerase V